MSGAAYSQAWNQARIIRGERLLRGLHGFLPLGRKYHPLLSAMNGRRGLLAIPFNQCQLIQPASWAKQITNQLLNGVDVVPEFRLLAPLARQQTSGCLLDVGANIGLYTLLLRSVSSLPIIAYEPQPFLFKLLQANLAFNHLANVEARNYARLKKRRNSVHMNLSGTGEPHLYKTPIP
ncbi:MAG TPA: FkbM family methyltransferase [Candidatus Angelobacter sp.]|nr:FkbM family methyltransferase [Candidatus Angelobacter sp.]